MTGRIGPFPLKLVLVETLQTMEPKIVCEAAPPHKQSIGSIEVEA
jgi:hypothetical protein